MNTQLEVATTEPASAKSALPECQWVYFANTAVGSGAEALKEFVQKEKIIVAHIYNANKKHHIRMPLVRHLKEGQKILLFYGGDGELYHSLLCCTIGASAKPVEHEQHSFGVFLSIDDKRLENRLQDEGYKRDPVIGEFTAISLTKSDHPPQMTCSIPHPPGNNTLRRWDEVFPA